MKIKTNIRAGQGGSTSTDSTSVDTSTSSGVNSGGVNSNKASGGKTVVVYYPPVGRCVGY